MEHRHQGMKKIEGETNNQDYQNYIDVKREHNKLVISIDLEFIKNNPNFDIVKTVALATSPFFTNEDKKECESKINKPKEKKGKKVKAGKNAFPHVAFFIEDRGHYTGGRYSFYSFACILAQYTKVTVVCPNKLPFEKDFEKYNNENFNIEYSPQYLLDKEANQFDIIIGIPQISGQYAHEYAKKFDLPLYMGIFETPNWIVKYRDGLDAHEEYWKRYKICMKDCDGIIVPSKESAKWVEEWNENFKDKNIYILKPCINELVARDYKIDKTFPTTIVFSSRVVDFKNPFAIFKLLGKDNRYIIIGKLSGESIKTQYNELLQLGYDIQLKESVSDEEKFEIISSCDVLVHPSKFEGFGMSPMEALYYNKPSVVYDLPVLRENYDKNNLINFVKLGDRRTFVQKVKEVLRGERFSGKKLDNFPKTLTISHNLKKQKEILNLPRIDFGVLAYNCADYINEAINSIYSLANQIIIIQGAVRGYSDVPNSKDSTTKMLHNLKRDDYLNKIKIISRKNTFWNSKIEMQNAIAKRVSAEYYVKLDADEIWDSKELEKIINVLENNPYIQAVRMPFLHFWTNFKTIAKDAGGKWSTKHYRVWRWKSSYRHRKSFNHFIDTENDNKPVVSPYVQDIVWKGKPIFHMGYCRELKYVLQKLKYYQNRGIESFVIDTYTNWKNMDDATQPTQKVRSYAEKFTGELPEVLKRHPYNAVDDVRELRTIGLSNEI